MHMGLCLIVGARAAISFLPMVSRNPPLFNCRFRRRCSIHSQASIRGLPATDDMTPKSSLKRFKAISLIRPEERHQLSRLRFCTP